MAREVFVKSPGKGTAVMAFAYDTQAKGGSLVSIEQRWSRSDTIDAAYYRWSRDNGRTWTDPVRRSTGEKHPGGMLRRHPRGGYVDAGTGRFLEIWIEGILPSDDPLEGMRQWNIYYALSKDGGRTRGKVHQVIHEGREFNAQHPLPGVFTGKNAVMIGDNPSRPINLRDGSILLPVQISPLGADGQLANPGGGYTYTDRRYPAWAMERRQTRLEQFGTDYWRSGTFHARNGRAYDCHASRWPDNLSDARFQRQEVPFAQLPLGFILVRRRVEMVEA